MNTAFLSAREFDAPAFALALTVLRDRVRPLPPADRDDLCSLLPALLGDDPEERAAAQAAVEEIFAQQPAAVVPMDLTAEPDDPLGPWLAAVSGRLREARKTAGLTQEELAARSGIPQSHISRLEGGKHSPSAKTLERLADALGVAAAEFDRG